MSRSPGHADLASGAARNVRIVSFARQFVGFATGGRFGKLGEQKTPVACKATTAGMGRDHHQFAACLPDAFQFGREVQFDGGANGVERHLLGTPVMVNLGSTTSCTNPVPSTVFS